VRPWLAFGLTAVFLSFPAAAGAQSACVALGGAAAGYTQFVPTGYSPYTGFASYPGGPASGLLPPGYSPNPYSAPCAPASTESSAVYYYPWNPYSLASGGSAGALASGPYGYGLASGTSALGGAGALSGYGLASSASTWPAGPSSAYGTLNYLPYGSSAYTGFASYPGLAPAGYASAGGYGAAALPTGYGAGASGAAGYSTAYPYDYGYGYGYGYGGVAGYPAGYGSAWGYGGVGGYSAPSTVVTWGCGGC
jgi:hypothetical protein